MTASVATFAAHLAARLDGKVLTDGGTLAAYASDASNHRVLPRAVVLPRSAEHVAEVVRVCVDEGVSVTSRGAGTNIGGSPLGTGVVVDHTRHHNRILELDLEGRTAVIEPGLVLDHLQAVVTGSGLRFGPAVDGCVDHRGHRRPVAPMSYGHGAVRWNATWPP
jgi:FAD/FMN-containing dehydrogenase